MDQTFVILLLLLSAAASAQDVEEVKPGDHAVLPCDAADVSIRAVKWTRTDLKTEENVLFYTDGRQVNTSQHPSFSGRVQLVKDDLKNGDASLKLRNVNINDAGTYECRVFTGSARRKRATNDDDLISSIRLEVKDVVKGKPGEDAVLPCEAGDVSIRAVKWTRTDLKPEENVLFYRGGHQVTTNQHPSFRDRVQLVKDDLKNGDVSVILKNVNINDAGTYECRVSGRLISSITLEVKDVKEVKPGEDAVLRCEAADVSITAVKWIRTDLKSDENVFLYRDGRQVTSNQHLSFRDRVQLRVCDLKNGDVSLILRNVKNNDAGTYECQVFTGAIDPLISSIRLEVKDEVLPSPPPPSVPGWAVGLIVVLVVGWAVCSLVLGCVIWIQNKRKTKERQEDEERQTTEKLLKEKEELYTDVNFLMKQFEAVNEKLPDDQQKAKVVSLMKQLEAKNKEVGRLKAELEEKKKQRDNQQKQICPHDCLAILRCKNK